MKNLLILNSYGPPNIYKMCDQTRYDTTDLALIKEDFNLKFNTSYWRGLQTQVYKPLAILKNKIWRFTISLCENFHTLKIKLFQTFCNRLNYILKWTANFAARMILTNDSPLIVSRLQGLIPFLHIMPLKLYILIIVSNFTRTYRFW